MQRPLFMSEKYPLPDIETDKFEKEYSDREYSCIFVCRYAQGFIFRLCKTCVMAGQKQWAGKLMFYSTIEHRIYTTRVFDEIHIHAVDKEHGVMYAQAFDFIDEEKSVFYTCKDDIITDSDVFDILQI